VSTREEERKEGRKEGGSVTKKEKRLTKESEKGPTNGEIIN
jgi:hypothetical protein